MKSFIKSLVVDSLVSLRTNTLTVEDSVSIMINMIISAALQRDRPVGKLLGIMQEVQPRHFQVFQVLDEESKVGAGSQTDSMASGKVGTAMIGSQQAGTSSQDGTSS